jgi:hypothetical protein
MPRTRRSRGSEAPAASTTTTVDAPSISDRLPVWVPCTWSRHQDPASQHRRRSSAARRFPVLGCGVHSDPWVCDCSDDQSPSELRVDAYRDTAVTLLNLGLAPAPNVPAMRVLWTRGAAERRLVQAISARWAAVA